MPSDSILWWIGQPRDRCNLSPRGNRICVSNETLGRELSFVHQRLQLSIPQRPAFFSSNRNIPKPQSRGCFWGIISPFMGHLDRRLALRTKQPHPGFLNTHGKFRVAVRARGCDSIGWCNICRAGIDCGRRVWGRHHHDIFFDAIPFDSQRCFHIVLCRTLQPTPHGFVVASFDSALCLMRA